LNIIAGDRAGNRASNRAGNRANRYLTTPPIIIVPPINS